MIKPSHNYLLVCIFDGIDRGMKFIFIPYFQKKNKLIFAEKYAPKDGFVAFCAKMLRLNGFSKTWNIWFLEFFFSLFENAIPATRRFPAKNPLRN